MVNIYQALSTLLLMLSSISYAQHDGAISGGECSPNSLQSPKLEGMWVKGELSGFDPCHSSVIFKLPTNIKHPPLLIAVHGGGGRRDVENITNEFSKNGMATLIFDAYQLNGFGNRKRFGNASRQMMLLKIAYQAYEWALKRKDININRIYFYGISNGASVVLNLAGMVSPENVKGIFSEAPTPVGIGYPWEIKVPVEIAFGQLDDLGAKLGQKRWMISDPCRFVGKFLFAPPGTADECNNQNSSNKMLTTLEWVEKISLGGGNRIRVSYFDGVAHGAFIGPLTIQTAQEFATKRGFNMSTDMGWSEGGTDEGRAALMKSALAFFKVNSK